MIAAEIRPIEPDPGNTGEGNKVFFRQKMEWPDLSILRKLLTGKGDREKMSTQILAAQRGVITPEMEIVARKENLSPEVIREGTAKGHIVIPANINHKNLVPVGIGRKLTTKINANIGSSPDSCCPEAECEKLAFAVKYGADTVMDLSNAAEAITPIRRSIIAASKVPVGTVPIYEIVAKFGAKDFTKEHILTIVEEQAKEGVDYMTIHAGLLRKHIPLALNRLLGIVSRGGSLIAQWMQLHNKENPFYTAFDEILAICRKYDVTLSLGDGLRPGCLKDASDEAQFAELEELGKLVKRCRAAGVQAMVEGPGHIPYNEIRMNMEKERELCDDAPFYILGPVVVDCAPGYDHITGAIGGTAGAFYGAAMLCYVTPMEHLGLPEAEHVRSGVIAFKLAALAADTALGKPGAGERSLAISKARSEFNWEKQFACALDPDMASNMHKAALARSGRERHDPRYCTMCGKDFCSMRISARLKAEKKKEE